MAMRFIEPAVSESCPMIALANHCALEGNTMSYPNATETLEHILKPASLRLKRRDILNQQTEQCFLALSEAEQKNLTQWLQSHLADIPMPPRTKQTALEKLLMGDYHHLSTLTLIRYTLKVLRL